MSQDELSKKEEDRINRTLNNIGRRAPTRPVSWNVPQTTGLAGGSRGGSIGKNSGLAGLAAIQEQIREEERRQAQIREDERRQAQQAQHVHPGHPQYVYPTQPQQAPVTYTPQHNGSNGNGLQPSGDTEDSEKDRKMRQEEERLERWMRKGGSRFDSSERSKPIDSGFDRPQSPVPAVPILAASRSTANLPALSAKFQEQILQAAKALRQKKSEDVVKRSFAVVATAKAIAEVLNDDSEILSYARALEAGASLMRTNLDSGGDGQQHNYELAGYLGQIFITTIGAL